MKKLLSVLLVAGLLVGCGDEQQQAVNDPSIPAAIPCMACSKPVSKKTDKCPQCGHPTPDSVVAYKKAQELARIRAEEEERRLAEIRAEEERKAKPFGGLEVLAKIKEAKESGATEMTLFDKKITDLADPNEAARNSNARKLLHEAMVSDARSYGGKSNRSLPRRRSSGRWISGWRRSDGRRGCTGQCRGQGG